MAERDIQDFFTVLNCRFMAFPFVYLGVPVRGNPRRRALWQPILLKLRKKLSSWKKKTLSFGGRACLLKSVLSTLPLFFLSFLKVPKGFVTEATSIMRNFLWGGYEEETKLAWVRWEKLCWPKNVGGLRVKECGRFRH